MNLHPERTAMDRASAPSTDQETRMKALVQDKYGAPQDVLTLQEIEKPTIGEEDVLVQVRAAGVHIGDWLVGSGLPYMIRMGYGLTKPKNRVPGMEFSGQIEAVGQNVTQFQLGDDVFGFSNAGAFAEYVSVSQDAVAMKPTNGSAMLGMCKRGRRSSSLEHLVGWARMRCRLPRRSVLR